jgi:hypothetical protein
VLAITALAVVVPPVGAQSAPDLSGTWVLNVAKSQMGGAALRYDTSVVTRVGNSYRMVSINDVGTGRVSDTAIVPAVDGEANNMVRGVHVHGVVTYKGDTSVASSNLTVNDQTVAVGTSRTWVSADTRTLTKITDLRPASGAPIHMELVYDRVGRKDSP